MTYGPTDNWINVDGVVYQYMLVPCSDATYDVVAPGVPSFSVLTRHEAKVKLTDIYKKWGENEDEV